MTDTIFKINTMTFEDAASQFGTILGRSALMPYGTQVFVVELPGFGSQHEEPYAALWFEQDTLCYPAGCIAYRSPVELANKIADVDALAIRAASLYELREAYEGDPDNPIPFPAGVIGPVELDPDPMGQPVFIERTYHSGNFRMDLTAEVRGQRSILICGDAERVKDAYRSVSRA